MSCVAGSTRGRSRRCTSNTVFTRTQASTSCPRAHFLGPIVRISPHELHVDDAAYFEKLFRQDGRWHKYWWSYERFAAKHSTVFCVDHDVHRRRRAPLNSFFSKAHVAQRQAIVRDKVHKLCYRLSDAAGKRTCVNLSAAVGALVRDVAMEFILGHDFHNLAMEDYNGSIGAIFQASGIMWRICKFAPWFRPLINSLPRVVTRHTGDDSGKAFLRFRKVGISHWRIGKILNIRSN